VDEKEEDRSEDSFHKHLVFYKKLDKKISEIQISGEAKILKHLNERIEAIELDQARIRKMFPKVNDETWKGLD
jgi:hypothetical protein